jgi:hypothetical protein
MQPTLFKSLRELDRQGLPCDTCHTPLPPDTPVWAIDDVDDYGFFCSKHCAELELKQLQQNPPAALKEPPPQRATHRPPKPDKEET